MAVRGRQDKACGVKGTLGPRPPNEEPRASFQSWTTGLQARGLRHSSFCEGGPPLA